MKMKIPAPDYGHTPIGAPGDVPSAVLQLNQSLGRLRTELENLSISVDRTGRDRLIQMNKFLNQQLPDLSVIALNALQVGIPDFPSHMIDEAKHQHKILGLLAGPAYRHTLDMVRSQAVMLLEQRGTGPWKDQFQTQTAELDASLERKQHLSEALDRLSGAEQALQAAQKRGINAIPARVWQKPVASRPVASNSVGDDATDWWINWATGIPTSPRTLLWDALMDSGSGLGGIASPGFAGGGGTFGGGGSDGSWDSAPAPAPSFNDGSSIGAAIGGAALGVAAFDLASLSGIAPSDSPSFSSPSLGVPTFDLSSPSGISPVDPDPWSAPDIQGDLQGSPSTDFPSFDDSLAGSVDTDNGSYS
jgi:hypothetical protein